MYQKLFAIHYNNKNFLLFGGDQSVNYRIIFLELREDGSLEYPKFEDFQQLDKIYNKYDPTIIPIEKRKLTQKVRWKSALYSLIVAGTTFFITEAIIPPMLFLENTIIEQNSEKSRENLSLYFEETVTKEDVLEAIENNKKIPQEYKEIAQQVLEVNLKLDPEMDLRLFYENIKKMNFRIVEKSDPFWSDMRDYAGWYSASSGTVYVYEEYKNLPSVIFHEINHAAHELKIIKDGKHLVMVETRGSSLREAMTSKITEEQYETYGYGVERKFLDFFMNIVDDFNYHTYNQKGIMALIEELQQKYPDVDIDYIITYLDAWTKSHNNKISELESFNYKEFMDEVFKLVLENVKEDQPYQNFEQFIKLMDYDIRKDNIAEYLIQFQQVLKEKNSPYADGSEKLNQIYYFDKFLIDDDNMTVEEKLKLYNELFDDLLNHITPTNVYRDLDKFLSVVEYDVISYREIEKYIKQYDEKVVSLGFLSEETIQKARSIQNIIKTKDDYYWCLDTDIFVEYALSKNGLTVFPFDVDYHTTTINEQGQIEKVTLSGNPFEIEQFFNIDDQDKILRFLAQNKELPLESKETKEAFVKEYNLFEDRKCNQFSNGEEAFLEITPDMFVLIGYDQTNQLGFQLVQNDQIIYSTCDQLSNTMNRIPYEIYSKLYRGEEIDEEKYIDSILSKEYLDQVQVEILEYYFPNMNIEILEDKTREYQFEEPWTLIVDEKEIPIQNVFFYVNFSKDGDVTQDIYFHFPGEEDQFIGTFADFPAEIINTKFLKQILKDTHYKFPSNRVIELTREELNSILQQFLTQTEKKETRNR